VIDVEVHQALKNYSEDTGVSMSVLATNAIHELLKKNNYHKDYMPEPLNKRFNEKKMSSSFLD
jgi:hypothetical protein